MNDPNSLATLPFDQLKSSDFWQKASLEDRVSLTNKYFGDVAAAMAGTKDDTEENRQALNTVRRAALYETAPFLKQPEDIGAFENVSNAFTKSLNSFHENITLNLIQLNPEEAARYHREQERIYPTREGFGETLGRVTGMMIPTGVALISAPITGPMGLTGAAAFAAGAIYGATSAGSALGDIYQYEQATGDDVSSGKTAAVMAGHAIFEMATEMAGFGALLGTTRRIGQNLTERAAETVGKAVLNNEKRVLARAATDSLAEYFLTNKKAAFALGWAKMGLIEGTEEVASQIGQNVTDKLYRESGTLDGLAQTFKEGALGGLLLGPLAFGMEASAYKVHKDRMAAAGVDILDDALMVQARREAGAGANETAIRDAYTSLRNEYDAESPIDRAALDNPGFMFLKEYFGLSGTEMLPVRDSGSGKGKGALLTASDGTPVITVDTALLEKGYDGIFAFVAGHEFRHAMDKILGPEKSVTTAREIAGSVPEFAKYKTILDSARAVHQLGAISDTGARDEVTADIFGQVYTKPQFLGAAIDAAVKNPAIGREVVRTLKDMRSRFERMGRRLDAQMEYSRTAWAEAKAVDEARGDGQMTEQSKLEAAGVPILRLPQAAMEIAKAKIDGDITALDRMSVQFVKSFETSLARQAEPAKAKVVGGTEPPEDLLGREAAPMSVVEGLLPRSVDYYEGTEIIRNPTPADYQAITAEYRREFPMDRSGDPTTRFTTDASGNRWIWRSDAGIHSFVEPLISAREGVPVNQNAANFARGQASRAVARSVRETPGFSYQINASDITGQDPDTAFEYLADEVTNKESLREMKEIAPSIEASVKWPEGKEPGWVRLRVSTEAEARALEDYIRAFPTQERKSFGGVGSTPILRLNKAAFRPEALPRSIRETPDEIFNRAFDKDATAFRASDEAKVLEDVWEAMKPTSYVLKEMFLKKRRYVLPERISGKLRAQQPLSTADTLLLRNFNELPEWVKLRERDNPAQVKITEWAPDAIQNIDLLGGQGAGGDTAHGFLRENGLDPSGGWEMGVAVSDTTVSEENRMRPASDDGGTTNADHVLEALHANIKGYKTKGDFRRAVAAMMQTELKPHLDDLARRRVSKDIEARRITNRLKRMYDVVKPGTINRIVNEPTMNVTESLVSRDDLKVDDVIRQKDNLFVVDGFNADRSPIVTPLRASAPFDTTPGAVDDPMADPEMAKDYRFGMELPPVTPFYSVQAVFPLDMSVDAQDMAEEARAARPEEEVPFSIVEHGTPHVFAPEPGFPHGRFRLDKMGTGEGAQVYGWGVYFAENSAVAKAYAQRLSGDVYRLQYVGGPFFGESFLTKEAADAAKADLFPTRSDIIVAHENPEASSSVYRLDVPDDAVALMLDWDEPLSAQPAVFEKIKSGLGPELIDQMDADIEDSTIVDGVNASLAEGTLTGLELMSYLHRYASESPLPGDESMGGDAKREVAEFLARSGVPGLRYMDQGSRLIGGGIFKARWDATGTRAEVYDSKTGAVQGVFDTFSEADAWMDANKPGPTRNYVIWDQGLLDRITLLERNGKALDQALAAEPAPRSINEKIPRPVESDLNVQRNLLRKDTSFAPMEQAAKAILDANGAATHSEKLANLSKHKFIGREGDGTRAFAYDNLKKAGQAQLESKDKAAAAAYFGTPDERVWVAKIREAEKQSVAHASMQGLTLGVYSFIAKRNALDNPFARGTYYVGMFRDIAGGMSKEDITNLDLWQDAIMESRKDAAEDVRDELMRMGREEFNRAMEAHDQTTRKNWLRARFAQKAASAPLSIDEAAGDLLDKVFGPGFAQYYRRLKSPVGDVFQKELADAYGADNVALIVDQMEEHARLYPPDAAPAAPKVKTPAAQAAEVLLAKAEQKYKTKLDQAIANDFKGELQAYYAQKINRALPSLSLTAAARGAAMTPAERAKAIDVAFTALAKDAYEDLLKRKDGKKLASAGFLTLEGVTKDLEGIKAILKEREVAFTALSSALATVMRDANVTMADVLKASNETFGYVKTRLADDVKARLVGELAKIPGMDEFPDAIQEAAARAGRAVEQMLETRLADWIDDGNNAQMRDYNASRRAARTLVDVLSGANAPEMTAKPYSATSKGLAATLLGDPAAFKASLAATLQAAQTKAETLGQDIISPMAQALGLPATATLADIEAAVLSTRLPPAVARRVVEEHLATTGRTVIGLLEPLAHLEPGRVADELAAEFGADTTPLWEAALSKLMAERAAAVVKRLGTKRDSTPTRRKDLLDTLLFAAATGQFDDASLMEHVSKAAGLPVLSESARGQLKALVEDELKAIRETGDPDSSFVQPFTVKIARLLAGEAVRHWRAEGKKAGLFRFSKIDRERLVLAFYTSALSGPRTWLVTNPVGSTLKTLATLMELSAKNAGLDRTLKKQGLRGVLKAWAFMFKAANIDGMKAAIKDDMSPGRIRRRFDFGGAVAASSFDNPDTETRLFGAGEGLWSKIERFTYGITQKYVPRFIRAGDVGPFGLGSDFASYEAARKVALETNPGLTVEQADLEAKRILGFTADGQIRPEFMAQAREEAAKLFGGQIEEYKIRNRAREIATAQRPDYVQRLGDFIGGEGTFTSDAGVRHVMTPGMDQKGRDNWLSQFQNLLSNWKNSDNAAVALTTTAIAPFTNIALKVFDSSLNYTLVPGLWRWKELQGLAAQADISPEMQRDYEEAADLALTRMVHGTLVTIAAMLLAAASRDDDPWIEITGAGPSDFKKNWQWREAGGRPWTITFRKFGGWQVDFRTSPFFSILAAAGAWADQKHLSEEDRSNAVVAYGAGFFKSTLNQSFMSSASDLLGAITEADTDAGRQKLASLFINPLTTAIVPASGLLRQVEEEFFPYPNVGRVSGSVMDTFLATTLSRVPMLNGFLPRKINALGRDVEGDRPTEVALGIQDWKRGSDEQAARVFDFSVAKRAWISVPNAVRTFVLPPDTALSKAEARRLADKDQALMTFAEYTAFMKRRGDIIVETFNKYEGELYKIEAGDKVAKVMDEIVSAAQDQAKRELLGLRPIKPGAVPADRKIRAAIRDAARDSETP